MEFSGLLQKKIDKLFLKVWTPWRETEKSSIDIAFGFVFKGEPTELYVISVAKEEFWTPHIYHQSLPKKNTYLWDDFYLKIEMWMNSKDENCIITNEYFDVTNSELFKKIVDSEIINIELIRIKDDDEPFGIKIIFKDDYIISTPIADGNTVKTSQFNQNNNVEVFKALGTVEYKSIL